MGSFAPAVRALTNHVLSDLHRDVVPRQQYTIFHAAICANFGIMVAANMFTPSVGPLSTWPMGACEAVRSVLLRMNVMTVLGNEGGHGQHNRTWAHVATVLGNALAVQRGVDLDDYAHFRVAMFVRQLRSQLTAPAIVVRQRQNALARDIIQFVVNEVTLEDDHFAGLEVDELQMEFVLPDNVNQPDVDAVPEEEEEEVDAVPEEEEEEVDAVPEEEEEEEVDAVPEEEEEEVDAVPEEEEEVEEVDAVPEDEDGDVVMETGGESEARGSKRRRGQGSSYKEELTRISEVDRRYNLRNTRARRERLERLKDDAKRKGSDDAGISSTGPRKKSKNR